MSLKLEIEKKDGEYELRTTINGKENISYTNNLNDLLQFIHEFCIFNLEGKSKFYNGKYYGRVVLKTI